MARIKAEGYYFEVSSQDFGITMAVNDLGSIESRQGTFSNDADIQATPDVISMIGFANDLNVISSDAPYIKIAATLFSNSGLPISKGYLQVNGYNRKNRTVNITYYGDNSDFFEKASGLKLQDLNLSRFDHTYNYVDISNSFGGVTEGYLYHPVNYGNKTNSTGSNFSITNVELLPATFVHTILDAIVNQLGFTIDGSFKKNPIYKKIILPFSKKKLKNNTDNSRYHFEAGYSSNQSYASGSNYDLIFDNELSDGSEDNYNPSTGIYTAKTNIKVRFTGVFDIQLESGTGAIWTLLKNGSVQEFFSVNQNNTGTNYTSSYYEAQEGDQFNIRVIVTGSNNLIIRSGSIFKSESDGDVIENGDVVLSKSLPDMTAAELIKDMAIRYGLIVTTNQQTKTVYLNEFNIVKKNIPNAIEWSDKIDASKEGTVDFKELISDYSKINRLLNAEDNNDTKLQEYKSENGSGFGDGIIEIDNDFIDGEDDLYESVFAATINVNSFTGTVGNSLYIPFIQRYEDGEITLEPTSRMLIYAGDYSVNDFSSNIGSITISSEYGTQVFTEAPFCYFYKDTLNSDVDNFIESLAFDRPNIGNQTDSTLLERYYQDYIRILNRPAKVTEYFRLTETDIINLDWTIPIYLDQYNGYFYLNKINEFSGDPETTECELVKL